MQGGSWQKAWCYSTLESCLLLLTATHCTSYVLAILTSAQLLIVAAAPLCVMQWRIGLQILQLAVLEADVAILDEIDSGA
jgi:hypothetical protein